MDSMNKTESVVREAPLYDVQTGWGKKFTKYRSNTEVSVGWLHENAEKRKVYVIYVPISLEVCCRVSGV